MSNYQRLISYIYEYEGGNKGRNVGFAKLETRGGQCKVTVSIKKIYVGGNPMGVFLLSGQGELNVGNAFVRNGACEFRAILNSASVEGSGIAMSQFYGLSVHEVENAWRSYTTIWEDAVAHAAEIELADVTSANVREQEAADPEKEKTALPISKEIEEQLAKEELQRENEPVIQNPAFVEDLASQDLHKPDAEREGEELAGDENGAGAGAGEDPGAGMEREMGSEGESEDMEREAEAETEAGELSGQGIPVPCGLSGDTMRRSPLPQSVPPQCPPPEGAPALSPEFFQRPVPESAQRPVPESAQHPVPESAQRPALESVQCPPPAGPSAPPPAHHHPAPAGQPPRQPIGNDAALKRLEEEEQSRFAHQNVWERLRKKCPKIQAFDYDNPCEILTIKPQDIGLLPREAWIFGNNSFLLHGYYNYRYLILARLESPQGGRPRYLLGVPGHYYSNEKYMATMFGFANFVLSKNQPPKDGRFGYWYTDIKVGD